LFWINVSEPEFFIHARRLLSGIQKRGRKMKKRYAMFVMPVMVGIFFCFLLPAGAAAADKVVVIPLGGCAGMTWEVYGNGGK
jgi:hypothetical protein